MIGFISSATKTPMPLRFSTGQGIQQFTLGFSVSLNSADSNACLAIHGLGLIQVPRYRVEQELASGQLVEVPERYLPPSIPVYLLYPKGRQRTPRAQVFMEWAEQQFRRQLDDSNDRQICRNDRGFEASNWRTAGGHV